MAIASMPHSGRESNLTMPRLSLEMAGLLTFLLGAWAGIVPFVGPLFGFSGDGTGSWHWNLAHALLFLIPGAAAMVAGIIVMVGAIAGRRALLDMMGLLSAVCGAWLVAGPVVWPVLEGTSFFRSDSAALSELAYWIGYSLGPGGLLLALGAFILGRARFQPTMDVVDTAL